MKKWVLIACGALLVALLAFRHPGGGAQPAVTVVQQKPSRHRFVKGHSFDAIDVVYVVGAVGRPGLYRLNDGSRVDDAVRAAGGFGPAADRASVNLAERIADGDEIHVLRTGETASRARLRKPRTPKARRHSRSVTAQSLDLNSANADALASLPGVGPTLAERIVTFRQLNGPFTSVDQLADVAGMTQRRVDALASYLRVDGP